MLVVEKLDPADQATLASIRDNALKHLFGDDTPFDGRNARRTIKRIAQVADTEHHPVFLEASILTRLIAGAPPGRVRRSLKALYIAQCARQEPWAFETFKRNLQELVEKGSVQGPLPFPVSFADLDHDRVWKRTAEVIEVVQAEVGDVWLNSGTLLGSVRDGAFLLHDDDVDLAVLLDAKNQQEVSEAWAEVYFKLLPHFPDIFAPLRELRVMKLPGAGTKVDIFPAWLEEGKVWVYPHTTGQLDADALLPLGKCKVSGLPVPARPEAFLELNYGSSWRVPDPAFSFDWDAANRNFRPFKQAVYASALHDEMEARRIEKDNV